MSDCLTKVSADTAASIAKTPGSEIANPPVYSALGISAFPKLFKHGAQVALAILLCTFIVACQAGDGDETDDGTDPIDGSSNFTLSGTVDDNGRARVSFNVPGDTTKFSVVAEISRAGQVRFTDVSDDEGNDYLFPGRDFVSLGGEPLEFLNVVNVPSRDIDPPVDASRKFSATAVATGLNSGDTITFTINAKADTNLATGRLKVNIFYVGEVGQDASAKAAIAGAMGTFQHIYRDAAAVAVEITEINIDGPTVVPSPFDGDSFYLSASRTASSPAVNIFVGGDIEGASGGDLLGISGGIPGPGIPTRRSGVAISLVGGAGPDGRFSDEDLRVLGETMAHESGHFAGLFHPVDFSGQSVDGEDPLSDTPVCSVLFDCASNTNLITNLMFATPVSDGNGGLIPQDQLSPQQRAVVNRYAVVD